LTAKRTLRRPLYWRYVNSSSIYTVNNGRPKPRYDFSERDKFELELRNRFELLDTPDAPDPGNRQSAETEWQTLKAAVTGTAAKNLSKKTRTVKKEWIKPDTFALMEEKRNCERHGERYKDLKRQVRQAYRLSY